MPLEQILPGKIIYGKAHSKETRGKMSAAKQGALNQNSRAVIIRDLQSGIVTEFESQAAAARWLSVSNTHVGRLLRTGKVLRGRYSLKSNILPRRGPPLSGPVPLPPTLCPHL